MIVFKVTLTFLWLVYWAEARVSEGTPSISITRRHKGDLFSVEGGKYYKEACRGVSGGTAVYGDSADGNDSDSQCTCEEQHPVYRDDLNACVDDIQECSLAPFVSGTIMKKIPFVFLPLKGQIVHPSAEIVVSEYGAPVCVVSGGQFLGRNGWMNLRNNSDTEPPFRLFRDEGRTYLQWFGESSMRMAMEGRIILVHLMCKDASSGDDPHIFTPCVAFRVAGNPSVREVAFATDVHLAAGHAVGLTTREYVAIGLCSLFLAVVYVASIFLYLHWRKRKKRKNNKKKDEDTQLTLGEEGIVKSNPLLQASRHLGEENAGYATDSNSCCSDQDKISDLLRLDEEDVSLHLNVQTSAIVHPCELGHGEGLLNQDPNSIERLPEENVSIVETLEAKEGHPETMKALVSSNGRRKLYFNPSYFEPELLKAPPPAALEFLVKIREVIAIAKHKMSNKKFSPSLLGIPEEEDSSHAETTITRKERSSSVENESIVPTQDKINSKNNNRGNRNEFCCSSDVKQKIIQKWLEDVPVMISKLEPKGRTRKLSEVEEEKIFKNPNFWRTNEIQTKSKLVLVGHMEECKMDDENPVKQEKKRPSIKTKPPPLPPQPARGKCRVTDAEGGEVKTSMMKSRVSCEPVNEDEKVETSYSPPPVSSWNPNRSVGSSNFEHHNQNPRNKNITKNLMDAVIQELTGFKKGEKQEKQGTPSGNKEDVPDNLSKGSAQKSILTERIDFSGGGKETGGKASEENTVGRTTDDRTMAVNQNDESLKVKGIKSGNGGNQEEHEYEVILLNGNAEPAAKGSEERSKTYNVSEVLSKCERNEGYSLVSEVYVNDDYSCYSRESPPTRYPRIALESEKISYEVMNEKTSRLTIHVKDSPKEPRDFVTESDNFEPDTLERKQCKTKQPKQTEILDKGNNEGDRYSNQRFHGLERQGKAETSDNGENFTDSLERPTIMLKTNGSFKRNSLERDVNELFRNLNWARMETFGSLREIYEAKSRNHRRRTATTSLIDSVNSDNDCISTRSWCEERRNKLLHRGIVLHIDEDVGARPTTVNRPARSEVPLKGHKPWPTPRSESTSPVSLSPATLLFAANKHDDPPATATDSPPLPPPRSLPASPQPLFHLPNRSCTPSPLPSAEGRRSASSTPPPLDPPVHNNTVIRVYSKAGDCGGDVRDSHLTSRPPTPPRPPKAASDNSPPLPPRNSRPPLPPKNAKNLKQKSEMCKFASRPLPPLPQPRPTGSTLLAPTPSAKDLETMSTVSAASADSLNSSEYESFYTVPYEEEEGEGDNCRRFHKSLVKNMARNMRGGARSVRGKLNPDSHAPRVERIIFDGDKKPFKKRTAKATLHKVEDSGYLSTDSSESYCPRILLPSRISKIPEKVEVVHGQNSETEESICDGASESGAESTATDSFFYGNFRKTGNAAAPAAHLRGGPSSTPYTGSFSLRLSDVEVNSDTERHCVPIMVRP